MTEQQKDLVQYVLHGLVIICTIIVISVGVALLISSPSHAAEAECNECGCTTEIEPLEIGGNAL